MAFGMGFGVNLRLYLDTFLDYLARFGVRGEVTKRGWVVRRKSLSYRGIRSRL